MGNGGKIALVAGLIMLAPAAQAACDPGVVEVRTPTGEARFRVEVADDNAERAQGLMNRPEMAMGAGMLFVYDTPRRASFWMKDTLIPLDMVFADATGTVVQVHAEAQPLDRTSIRSEGGNVKVVLEINGGLASRLGIAPGTVLRHPALDGATAAWPCAD